MQQPQPVFLTEPLAGRALNIAEPLILSMFNSREMGCKRGFVHVVILDALGNIAAERTIGQAPEGAEFEEQCARIARSKAQIHFRTGIPSRMVHERRPHALLVGDTHFGGSYDHDGLIAAASGVQSYFDETIAATVAAITWGLCKDMQERYLNGDHEDELFYDRQDPMPYSTHKSAQ